MNEAHPLPDAFDQRIDAALRRHFDPPGDLDTLAARTLPRRTRVAPWVALAVALAAGALLYLALRPPRTASPARPDRAAEDVARGILVAEPTFCRLVGPLRDGQPEPGLVHSPDLERLYRDMDNCQHDAASCGEGDFLAERMSATYGQPLALRPEAAGRLQGPFGSDEWPTATIVTGTSDERTRRAGRRPVRHAGLLRAHAPARGLGPAPLHMARGQGLADGDHAAPSRILQYFQ
jgi:hypothetical protein